MTRNLKSVTQIGLMALALCLAAAQAKAQGTYEGKFTLPFEVRWGIAVLPPGDYTISMVPGPYGDSSGVVVRGEDKSALILPAEMENVAATNHSQLSVVKTDAGYAVQALDAGQVGLKLNYFPAENKRERAPQELKSELILPVATVSE
jgi:hypothetical protein